MIKIHEYYSFVDKISKPLGRLLMAQVGWMESMGISGSFLPLVIVVEIFGSLGLIFGWKTRVCAILLCGYCFLTAVLFHMNFLDPMQQISFMKNIALSGGLLYVFAHGAGRFSLDNRNTKYM